jgi:hypothetical protein
MVTIKKEQDVSGIDTVVDKYDETNRSQILYASSRTLGTCGSEIWMRGNKDGSRRESPGID